MMNATHSERYSHHRLAFQEHDHRGNGIFIDIDANDSRVVCPITPDHVLPYQDRSEITSVKMEELTK